ncbi:hypothetical protein HDR60_05715 [bacterium]|nr:hypothetical protein [bacterium]
MKTMNLMKTLCIGFLVLILATISYIVLKNFVFMFDDDILYVAHHIYDNNLYFYDRICDYGARFCPLQFFDYNIIKIFDYNNRYFLTPYYILLKFFISIILFIFIIKDIEKFNKLKINFFTQIFFLLFFIINSVFEIAMDVKFSELMQGICVLLFILFYQKWYFTNKTKYFIWALLSCIYATYMKETMFIPFFVIGITGLLFSDKKNKSARALNLLLILNGIIYLILYIMVYKSCYSKDLYFIIHPCTEGFKKVYTFKLVLLFSFIRGYKFFKTKKISLYDNFLFAGCAFAIVMYILNLRYEYYYWISHMFLSVFLVYYFNKIYNKLWKVSICIIMSFCIYKFLIENYYCYKWSNHRRKNTITFINNTKNRDVILLGDNYIFKKYNQYLFAIDNILYIENLNEKEILNIVKNLNVNKEYVFITININFNLINDKFTITPFNFFSYSWGNEAIQTFIMTPK